MMKKTFKCSCGGLMKQTDLEFEGFIVKGWKCASCGEELVDPWAVDAIREIRHGSPVKVREVGKSLVVTIPSPIKNAAGLRQGETVAWRAQDGELVLGKHLLKRILPQASSA